MFDAYHIRSDDWPRRRSFARNDQHRISESFELRPSVWCPLQVLTTFISSILSILMAPRSEEAAAWFASVYRAIQEIPYGKVTSYGHIARLVGYRES